MRAKAYVNSEEFPAVANFLDAQVEMQFEDLRVMLRLPLGGWRAGCNFAAATVLLNLISGFSVCLFQASNEPPGKRRDSGARFKNLLRRYYPWGAEPWEESECGKRLYCMFRNPLSHSLGIPSAATRKWDRIGKQPLTPPKIALLEGSSKRPDWLGPTLIERTIDGDQSSVCLSIPSLYWGVWRMLERICGDAAEMSNAEHLLIQFGFGSA